jgi:hypothetical protein
MSAFLCLAFVDTLGFHAADPEQLPFIIDELPLVLRCWRGRWSRIPESRSTSSGAQLRRSMMHSSADR